MKLDRTISPTGKGKYALIKLRGLDFEDAEVDRALKTLRSRGVLDWGIMGTQAEFFVIRLKDKYAAEALEAYANEAGKDDPEYADEIREMADRAGPKSRFCKRPD